MQDKSGGWPHHTSAAIARVAPSNGICSTALLVGRAKKKVKSGCGTCKIRKIKCDELRPVCLRCVTTGRVCDGYGVWGGGNTYGQRSVFLEKRATPLCPPAPATLPAVGVEEIVYFEWFKCRTVAKLPGGFSSRFWDTLLFQASVNEPAVLYAVLALGSLHKDNSLSAKGPTRCDGVPNKQEQFMLRQYLKAIHHLQPHFSARNKSSFRVALITCVVFVSLEFLRGRFQTAQIHLENGVKILKEMHVCSNADDDGILLLKSFGDPIDDWIVGAISRLHFQVELFRQSYQHSCVVLQFEEAEPPTTALHSTNQAWQRLNQLLYKVFHLKKQANQRDSKGLPVQSQSSLFKHQQKIREELTSWIHAYQSSRVAPQAQDIVREEYISRLLLPFYAMAEIMNKACLCSNDESILDSHTDKFVSLIVHAIAIRRNGSPNAQFRTLPGFDMSRSVVDMGWIPPLYYTALKCRNHRVRLQAIKLLEYSSHREGIWDAKIMTSIARKVMEMEESNFYEGFDMVDDFVLTSYPEERDLAMPVLPQSYRMHEVKVMLPDEPMGKVLVFCKQKQESGDWKTLLKEYDVHSQLWTE